MPTIELLKPDWPAADRVRAYSTTRLGGVSQGPYAGFNLATHVEDDPQAVSENRAGLRQQLDLPAEPVWLNQVHGVEVVDAVHAAASNTAIAPQGDASFAQQKNTVCSVMTADCLPVLMCNRQASKVAAAHAGWRGLQSGVIEATVESLDEINENLLVWLGPAIGPQAFEVGDEVRAAFVDEWAETQQAFRAHGEGHWLADIYQLARLRLNRIGIEAIYGGDFCTYSDARRFYSYRRDGKTGRMASLIWLAE